MIQRLSHMSIYVLDQVAARDFYSEKLGFEVLRDEPAGPFRWITIAPRGQKDLELVLIAVTESPVMDAATAEALRGLVRKGAFLLGIFETADCRRTYDELSAKGVELMGPPVERPYGTEAMFKDNSGNMWSIVQRPR